MRRQILVGTWVLALAGAMLLFGPSYLAGPKAWAEATSTDFTLTSPAFEAGGEIPRKYTCEGEGMSPPLVWSRLPAGTRSLALTVEDPDAPDPAAPKGTWVHWVLYDIPPTAKGLPEGASKGALPSGTRVGKNDAGQTSFYPPCPPIGRHRYIHKLYALDKPLGNIGAADKAALKAAMEGHLLGKAKLTGTYSKRK